MDYIVRGSALTINLDGKHLAHVKFHIEGNQMFLDSTYTPEEFRGRGIGGELMRASVDYATKNKLVIVPSCSFAV